MDQRIIEEAKQLAVAAAKEAGAIAKDYFDKLEKVDQKGDNGDFVTVVDHLAEERILEHIRSKFPDHRIRAEESGDHGRRSDWLWLVDPLDGTNNYAIGLPAFSCSITLMHQGQPVVAVVYEPMIDRLFVSTRNGGATCNGQPVTNGPAPAFNKATVAWIQGHVVGSDDRAIRLRNHVDLHTKRMMRLWAPTLQWCMLARGNIDAIILYNSEGEDLYSGVLIAKEAGMLVMDFEGKPFDAMTEEPYLIACHPELRDYFLNMVAEGLGAR
ncbi:inositol monophosphatase family protein [Paenibacillus cineris]|uniref:Fructose-1, 6-bisphosphatase/inositol-1-monophosph atase n=1 Tax=Paenibacillus cineris TaxID=237530 RepID=A0ABQ4L761_9BACL|nr:inositol monophosphatase family protein [Paenibacillus cineris]GIO52112.1 fructose-1,6-bisphosphatase/inositol-1-monophosph atase [Paenibacillus cineris]